MSCRLPIGVATTYKVPVEAAITNPVTSLALIVQDPAGRMAASTPLGYNAAHHSRATKVTCLMLRMNRLPLAGLLLASLIAGCSSTPRPLSELPTTTDTPLQEIHRQ